MTMIKFYTIILCILFALNTSAQHPGFSKLYSYSGDTSRNGCLVISLLCDTSNEKLYFQLHGNGENFVTYGLFLKTDLQGNVEKEKLDTLTGGSIFYAALAESRDKQYLYWGGGCFYHPSGSQTGYWVLTKTDKNLNVIWRKLYPTNQMSGYTAAIKTNEVNDDIVVLCAKYTRKNNLGLPQLPIRSYIRKLDSAGNLLSEYTPGLSSFSPMNFIISNDGGYIVGGHSNLEAISFKADEDGIDEWQKTHFESMSAINSIENGNSPSENLMVGEIIVPGEDGVHGFVQSSDMDGNERWTKILTNNASYNQTLYGISNYNPGGYAIAGASWIEHRPGAPYGWLLRLDNQGEIIWNKTVTANDRSYGHEYLYRIITLPDGSIVAAGSSFGENVNGAWTQKGWVVRVDSNGCMNPECTGNYLSLKSERKEGVALRIFPNPASDNLNISIDKPFATETTIRLTDIAGRRVMTKILPAGHNKTMLNIAELSSGIYLVELSNNDISATEKVTIRRTR